MMLINRLQKKCASYAYGIDIFRWKFHLRRSFRLGFTATICQKKLMLQSFKLFKTFYAAAQAIETHWKRKRLGARFSLTRSKSSNVRKFFNWKFLSEIENAENYQGKSIFIITNSSFCVRWMCMLIESIKNQFDFSFDQWKRSDSFGGLLAKN